MTDTMATAGQFPDEPTGAERAGREIEPEGPGTIIGPYRILQVLGEGGFGIVYLAEQREPVSRRVALKVIKPGMDTREVLARFEAERQAIAMMDHPNIAKVFDAGTTVAGRPYFAMEHVAGLPIHEYCDKSRLSTRERLELFIPVCQAVQHAHQKGIIHRDIKPSNILVSLLDGKPVPKVIDFGIAKATNFKLTAKTIFTEQGRMIGTPEYMSPEQAGTTGLDVDTRTDVYSLGVVLYQLLAGALPFDSKTLRSAGYNEIMRIIKEQDPPRMSTRLSSLGKDQEAAALARRVDIRSLEQQLRGDLDWITTRALEKDRTRRYGAASDLAADIERYLHSEPILARAPTAAYRASKFIRRHRVGVAAAALVLLALIVGAIGTSMGLVRAVRAEHLAEDQRTTAIREAARSTKTTEFVQKMISAVDPADPHRRDVTVREVVDEAAARVVTLKTEPELEAAIRGTLGRTYLSLGEYEAAEQQLTAALAVAEKTFGAESADAGRAKNDLGMLQSAQGKPEAEATLRAALALRENAEGKETVAAAATMCNLATELANAGKLEEARGLLEHALAIHTKELGADDEDALNDRINLGAVQAAMGKPGEAEKTFRDVIGIYRAKGAFYTRDMASTMNNLAELLRTQGKGEQAESLLREALAALRQSLGDAHPTVGSAMGNLGLALQQKGDLKGAQEMLRGALEIARRSPHGPRADIDIDILNLANLMNDLGETVAAEPLAREALAKARSRVAPGNVSLGFPLLLLGRILTERGAAAEGEPLLREAMTIWNMSLPAGDWNHAQVRSALGGCLTKLGRFDEAEPLLVESYPKIRDVQGEAHRRTQQALVRLVELYEAKGDTAKANDYRSRLKPPS